MTDFYWPHLWLLVALLGVAIVDEKTRRIPNGTLLALVFLWAGWLVVVARDRGAFSEENGRMAFGEALLLRVAVAVGLLLSFGALSLWRPRSIGMGDVKLMSVLALYFSPLSLGIVLYLALLLTFLRGLVLRRRTRERKGLAFAPQAAGAVLIVMLWQGMLASG